MADTSNTAPASVAEDDSNSAFSHEEDGSSGEEMRNQDGSGGVGRKRKRKRYQKTSCELCKARKVKCDRGEPACLWCARHNRACVYLERQKPGSRIAFTIELEAKVNRVDALLQTLWRRVEDHIANDHGPNAHVLSPAVSNHTSARHNSFGKEFSLPGPPALLRGPSSSQSRDVAVSSPSRHRGDGLEIIHQPTPSFTSAPVRTAQSNGVEAYTPPSRPDDARTRSTSLSGANNLPPQDMIYTLVDLYFKHCNTWCPILDRKTTFTAFFGSTSLSDVDRVLLHAIVATTLRFLKDSRLSPEMRSHYHAVSRHTVMIYAMEHVSIAAQRALVILALDELGTSNGPRGWNILSILTQNVRQLNLGDESSLYLCPDASWVPSTGSVRRVSVPRPDSWIEDEGRRRLCWMVYLLDRYATIATTTLDFMLEDSRMKRVLPCSYDLFSRNIPVETQTVDSPTDRSGAAGYTVNRPENLGSFSYHCEILRILSRVHEFLKAPVDITRSEEMTIWRNTYRSLDAALDNWLQSLPSEYGRISALCHSDPASRVANWFMLHSAYVTAVVRLHSCAAYPAIRSDAFMPSHYAMQRCLSAVQSLRDITQDVYEANGLDLVGPPFAFSLWIAARLLIVHAAATGCEVDSNIDFFIDILSHVGQYWDVANSYARILGRVVQRNRHGEERFGSMRQSACELVYTASTTRRSGLDETCSRTVSIDELDTIDVFDFFNYPKVNDFGPGTRPGHHTACYGHSLLARSEQSRDGEAPDSEPDWLGR